MDIVISSIVRRDLLQRVPRESIATVVINCLNGGHGKEPHALAGAHSSGQEGHTGTSCVEQETFNWVIVQSTEGVRNVEAMMAGVKFD